MISPWVILVGPTTLVWLIFGVASLVYKEADRRAARVGFVIMSAILGMEILFLLLVSLAF